MVSRMLQKIAHAIRIGPFAACLGHQDLNIEVAILMALARLGPLSAEEVRVAVAGSAGGTSRHLKELRRIGEVEAELDSEHTDTLGRPRGRNVYRLTVEGRHRVAGISERLAWLADPSSSSNNCPAY